MNGLPVNFKNRGGKKFERYLTLIFLFLYALLLILAMTRLYSLYFVEGANLYVYNGVAYRRIDISGSSMENTLYDGEYVYIDKKATPVRGDIVVIDTPKKTLIKRVIAVGGDRIALDRGVLYLNGEMVEEPYVGNNSPNKDVNTFAEITIKDGYIFCMGDNRDYSADSRSDVYGQMPLSWVEGVVTSWSLPTRN